ncbi:MAG: DMT family transporter [Anaerolineae bacterium]|nr:DMT family transporter [Anaerolineae bacterium]
MQGNTRGVLLGLVTPVFLGMAPIFGKIAITEGADPFTVAAWRTMVAVGLLWVIYLLFARRFIYIYPAGLLGCMVIGAINGIGSLFYYGGLTRLDASLAQLLNGMYLIFVVLLSHIGGERLDARLIMRVGLAVVSLLILSSQGSAPPDWFGVGLMIANALMFAGTVILSQYVLFEMPAPTVTLYILTAMAILVAMVWVVVGTPVAPENMAMVLPPILLLGVTTALSRLALFAGVKFFGSLQTAVLALTEIAVALALAFIFLHERLTPGQMVGVAFMFASILLIRPRDILPRGINPNRLVSNIADIQFQWIAFDQAFGKRPQEGEEERPSTPKLTTTEIQMIRSMMGVEKGPVKPLSTNKSDYHYIPDQPSPPPEAPKQP